MILRHIRGESNSATDYYIGHQIVHNIMGELGKTFVGNLYEDSDLDRIDQLFGDDQAKKTVLNPFDLIGNFRIGVRKQRLTLGIPIGQFQ